MEFMKVIGLTGGIASGKSTASAYLRELGAAIFADFIKRVNRNIHLVIVRIDDADHFLIAVARRNPNQTAELAEPSSAAVIQFSLFMKSMNNL